MESNRFLKIVIIVLILLNIGTLAFLWVQKTGIHHPPHQGGPFEFLSHELGLSEQQREQYSHLRDEHHHAVEELQEKGREMRHHFFELLKQENNSTMVDQLAADIAGNQKQIELITFEHFQKVRSICTPEQQKKFDEVIQEALRMMAPKPPEGPPR
jgi:protein CpxP